MKKRRLFVGSLPLFVAAVFFLTGCRSPTDPGTEPAPPPPPGETARPPGIPQNVAVIEANERLTVTWDAVGNAAEYMVQHRIRDGEWSEGAETEHLTLVIDDLENDVEYEIRVRAGNSAGWGDWSEVATGTPEAPQDAPESPEYVASLGSGIRFLEIGWAIPAGATMYRVRIGESDDVAAAEYWPSFEYDHAAPPVMITDLEPETTYYVFVRAGNIVGWSDWVYARFETEPPFVPPPPASISLSRLLVEGEISVGWAISEGATMYRIRIGAVDDVAAAEYWPSLEYDHAAPPVTIYGLAMDATFHVFVKAGNEFGWSDWIGGSVRTESVAMPGAPTIAPSGSVGNRIGFEIGGTAHDGDDYGNAFIQQWLGWSNAERIANAPNVLSGVIGLLWGSIPGATHYDVFVATDGLHAGAPVPDMPADPAFTTTGLSYFRRNTQPNMRYIFWIRGRNEHGPGPISIPLRIRMANQMGVQTTATSGGMIIERADYPQNPTVTVLDEGVVRLNWSPADRAVWYEVYVGRSLAEVRVLAQNVAGSQPEIQGQTWTESVGPTFRGLVPYRRLSPLQDADGAARPWNARANDGAGAFGRPGEVFRIYGLETTIHGLDPNQEYFFVVRSLNHNGERGYRRLPWFLGTVGSGIRPTLAGLVPPTNVQAAPVSPGGGGQLRVTWDPAPGVTGYRVFFSTFPVFQQSMWNVTVTGGDATGTTLPGLAPNVPHFVWVSSIITDAGGSRISPPSAMAKGVPNERDGTEVVAVDKFTTFEQPAGQMLQQQILRNWLYIEVNDNDPRIALGYVLEDTGEQFFDYVVLFAINLRSRNCDEEEGDARNHHCSMNGPHIHMNGNVRHILMYRDKYIRPLQEAGIKVILGTLPDHDFFSYHTLGSWPFEAEFPWYLPGRVNPGVARQRNWFTGPESEYPFSPEVRQRLIYDLAEIIERYELDGFCIDDEWSSGWPGIGTHGLSALTTAYTMHGTSAAAISNRRSVSSNYADFIAIARRRLGPDKIIHVYDWHGTSHIQPGAAVGATFRSKNEDGEFIDRPVLPYLWTMGYANLASMASYGGLGFTGSRTGAPNSSYGPAAIGFHSGAPRPALNTMLNRYRNAWIAGNPYSHIIWYGLHSLEYAATGNTWFNTNNITQAEWISDVSRIFFGQNVIYVGPDFPQDWIKY